MTLSWTMDKVGPICRTVADTALVFDEIAGADPRDPSSVDGPKAGSLSAALKGKRIGFLREEFNSVTDPDVAAVFRAALRSLESLGAILEDVQLDDYPYQEIGRYTMNVEAACVFEPLWNTGKIELMVNKQRAIDWAAARMLPATDYLKMQRIRSEVCDYASGLFKRYAALVAPTSSAPAAFVDAPSLPESNLIGIVSAGRSFAFGNITGVPAVSVPCGFTPSELPLGLQFIGAPFDEGGILRLAYAYEQAHRWYERHPRL
jgi:aspartyl-tRNA(Asn)/glutamyl-tRNA(Gln) amidotransferase subunit A